MGAPDHSNSSRHSLKLLSVFTTSEPEAPKAQACPTAA